MAFLPESQHSKPPYSIIFSEARVKNRDSNIGFQSDFFIPNKILPIIITTIVIILIGISFADIEKAVKKGKKKETYKSNKAFRLILKHIEVKKDCGVCEFHGKRHIHFFIPVQDKIRKEQYEEGSQEQDYYDQMSIKNFWLMLEENGILEAFEKTV